MSKDILLTICVPTFNRADTLRETLLSLEFIKSWPFAVEILVADDASPDHSWQVMQEVQQQSLPMIRPLRHEKNIG
ncbi:MAG: glycosyltransferase family 2 protein, partial [Magnetococcales bacterium]|nr:glycosyltransferase family 2 protein [Magnetococcales bacterium]